MINGFKSLDVTKSCKSCLPGRHWVRHPALVCPLEHSSFQLEDLPTIPPQPRALPVQTSRDRQSWRCGRVLLVVAGSAVCREVGDALESRVLEPMAACWCCVCYCRLLKLPPHHRPCWESDCRLRELCLVQPGTLSQNRCSLWLAWFYNHHRGQSWTQITAKWQILCLRTAHYITCI